jgi:hypothetical protein
MNSIFFLYRDTRSQFEHYPPRRQTAKFYVRYSAHLLLSAL